MLCIFNIGLVVGTYFGATGTYELVCVLCIVVTLLGVMCLQFYMGHKLPILEKKLKILFHVYQVRIFIVNIQVSIMKYVQLADP